MDVWPLATSVMAAVGYGCVYAAAPSRSALRRRTRAKGVQVRTGVMLLVFSAVVGGNAFGSVLGPLVTLTSAMATGSTLILVRPWLVPGVRERGTIRQRTAR